ncbi:MAG: DUF3277 family protein [Desulfovibrionaceae bacterium]|nr:DUF3277 family protein [Desulfovibrionaceae bacterium]
MGAYSFLDVQASFDGPGGSFQLGSGSGNAEEGISIEPGGDKNIMTIGADGSVMHSLRADASGTVTVTLLRTSATNARLQNTYNFQTASSRNHGRNTIIIRNPVSGDVITCTEVAFAKAISNPYAVEGGKLVWTFHAGKIDSKLGTGTPEI